MSYKSKLEEPLEFALLIFTLSASALCVVLSVLAVIDFFEKH